MKVLVCGGAGYIGSHMCKLLALSGHEPITLDNLSTGHRWAVKWGPLIERDLLDGAWLAMDLAANRFDAVLHFAACSLVEDSMRDPARYFRNNVVGTLNLLDAMRNCGVATFVFSSSAAVYGNPRYTPVDELHPCNPISAYGWSKFFAEQMVADYCRAYGMRAVSLRYFNAAGADADGEIGEAHDPETHLLPSILKAALDPALGPVRIFGQDFDTPDGTCVRDYVHVTDLCAAHLSAIDLLETESGYHVFNLGSSTGHSVLQVLNACRRVCNGLPESRVVSARAGDPATLLASSTAASKAFAWEPTRGLDQIIADALRWHRNRIGK